MSTPYFIVEAKGKKVPVLLSVPHSGTEFPEEIKSHYVKEKAAQPDDTDWFVHELYNFASEMGITTIHAKYSRWVVDLNRDPESKPLYNDGRIITALSPLTDFFGDKIYTEEKFEPNDEEVKRRIPLYFTPYHEKINSLLQELKEEFGVAVLWEAHSIRQKVPTIRKDDFPDLILGNNDGKTANGELIEAVLKELGSDTYELKHNTPFKGGHITRSFGDPENNIHALQLEMTKVNYMEDDELTFSEERSNRIRKILKSSFEAIINWAEKTAN